MKNLAFIILFTILSFQILFSQNQAIKSFGNVKGIVNDICFSKDTSLLIITEGGNINVYDFKSEQFLFKLSGGHTKDILSIDILSDGSSLVSGGLDGLVILWDLKNKTLIKKFNYHKGVVTTVKFSPNNAEIASGASDNKVILYDLNENKVKYQFADHKKDISSVAFNSSGDLLASAGEDNSIFIKNTKTGELISKLITHKNFIRQIKFSNDDSRLVSCDDGSKLIVWKTENLNDIKVLKDKKFNSGWLLCADIYKDNQSFAIGSVNGKVQIITYFGDQTFKIDSPIQKILFLPDKSNILKLAVATRGKGVLIIDPSK